MASLLLVDDDPQIGFLVGLLARRGGHAFRHVSDARSAWDVLTGPEHPDLALVDVNLGGETGLSLCRRLQAAAAPPLTLLALFTHWGMPQDIAAGIEGGIEYLVAKDLVARPARWQRRVHEILAGSDGQPPAGLLGSAQSCAPVALSDWVDRVNQTVESAWPVAGTDLSGAVLRQTLKRERTATRWLGVAEGRLVALAGPPPPDHFPALPFLLQLADTLRRLLGDEESAGTRGQLAPLLVGFAPTVQSPL